MDDLNLSEFFVGDENYGLEVFERVGNEKTLFSLLDILQCDSEFNIFGNLREEWLKFRNDESRVRNVVKNAYGMSLEEFKNAACSNVESFNFRLGFAAVQKRYEEHSVEALSKITMSPYIDWGEKKLERSCGFVKGSWKAGDEFKERMFVFKSDIEFAKECLRRDYEEPTEELAIMQLCDARRTGNRRFPRFGWVWPQQCCILGRKELLKHPGKKSEWNSLYAIVAASMLDEPLKKSILSKIDDMKLFDFADKRFFKGNALKIIQIKSHYQVHLDKAEMEAVLPLIAEAAIPLFRRDNGEFSSGDCDSLDDEFIFENLSEDRQSALLDDMGDSVFDRLSSTMKQKQIVDAISVIYKKFPVESFKNIELFANNREFWETYDVLKHGVQGLRIGDLSRMASVVLAEMTNYRGTNGVMFFSGNAKVREKSGIYYIEDYDFTPDVAKIYQEQYLSKLKFNCFTNARGQVRLNKNDNEYDDLFAAGLLKAMFGNGKGYSVGGPIDTLAGFVEFIKHLAKNFGQVPRLVPELSSQSEDLLKPENLWPNINIENLLLLLGDIAESRDPENIPEGFPELVYALLVSAYPDYENRFEFFERESQFYTRIDVDNGADANRKFKSDYMFVDEYSASNKFAAIERNCIVLDEALRNGDMPVWSAAIMEGLLASGKDKLLDLFASSFMGIKELLSLEPAEYGYLENDADFASEISLGEPIDRFLGRFYGLGEDLSSAISGAEGRRERIFGIAQRVTKLDYRFVHDVHCQTRDLAVVQFNFSISRSMKRLGLENILALK